MAARQIHLNRGLATTVSVAGAGAVQRSTENMRREKHVPMKHVRKKETRPERDGAFRPGFFVPIKQIF